MATVQETLQTPQRLNRLRDRFRRLTLHGTLAFGLMVATDAIVIVDVAVWAGQRFAPPPVSFIQGQTTYFAEMFYAFAYGLMGWILASRLPRNPLGWIFQILGVSMAAQMAATFLVQQGHQIFRPLDFALLLGAWAGSSLHLPLIIMLSATIFALFPTGRPLSPRWAVGIWATIAGSLLTMLHVGTLREGLLWYPSLPNPFAAPAFLTQFLSWLGVLGLVLIVVGVVICAASIAVRYRRADDDEQAQVRWIALAVLLLAGAGVPFIIARYGLRMDYANGSILLTIALLAGCFLPVAAAIAILRYRLYNIDLIINRALVYIPLTAFLGGMYASGVALFQRVFIAVTGDRSDAAIVITTLVLASLFTPVKNSLQAIVDRRFKPKGPDHHVAPTDIQLLAERVAALEAQLPKRRRS